MAKIEEHGSLKAHRITNIIYLIVLVPFLILAAICCVSIMNCKSAGGYANMFGYYVIETVYIGDEVGFGQHQQLGGGYFGDENFNAGTVNLFKKVSLSDLRQGDMVAYYSGKSTADLTATNIDWNRYVIPSRSTSAETQVQSFGSGSTDPLTEDGKATVRFAKVSNQIGYMTTPEGTLKCMTYYSSAIYFSETGKERNFLCVDDIIGVKVENNSFLIWFISFTSSITGFLACILIPAVLLLIIKLVSMLNLRKYLTSASIDRKAQIITEEGEKVSYSKVVSSTQAQRASENSSTAQAKPQANARAETAQKTSKPQTEKAPSSTAQRGRPPKPKT